MFVVSAVANSPRGQVLQEDGSQSALLLTSAASFFLTFTSGGLVMPEHPLRLDATPPIPLLLKQQAVLLGTHKAGKTVMCLVEQVTCSSVFLYGAMRHPDERISRGAANPIKNIRAHTSLLAVEYIASEEDGVSGCLLGVGSPMHSFPWWPDFDTRHACTVNLVSWLVSWIGLYVIYPVSLLHP